MGDILAWIKQHPIAAAGIVFLFGVVAIWLFWPRKASSGGGTGSSDLTAYYAAAAANKASGDQVAIASLAAGVSKAQSNDALTAALAQYKSAETISGNQVTMYHDAATAYTTGQRYAASVAEVHDAAAQNIAQIQSNALVDVAGYQAQVGAYQIASDQVVQSNRDAYAAGRPLWADYFASVNGYGTGVNNWQPLVSGRSALQPLTSTVN